MRAGRSRRALEILTGVFAVATIYLAMFPPWYWEELVIVDSSPQWVHRACGRAFLFSGSPPGACPVTNHTQRDIVQWLGQTGSAVFITMSMSFVLIASVRRARKAVPTHGSPFREISDGIRSP